MLLHVIMSNREAALLFRLIATVEEYTDGCAINFMGGKRWRVTYPSYKDVVFLWENWLKENQG